MKLLHCRSCGDVKKLRREVTSCECGKSTGWYHEDGRQASFRGADAVLLGILNRWLRDALDNHDLFPGGVTGRGDEGWSVPAIIIPENSVYVTRLKMPGEEE